jgi:hypothetical protein
MATISSQAAATPGEIGQGQVILVGQLFWWAETRFSPDGVAVISQRRLALNWFFSMVGISLYKNDCLVL